MTSFMRGAELGLAQANTTAGIVGAFVLLFSPYPWMAAIFVAAAVLGALLWREHDWAVTATGVTISDYWHGWRAMRRHNLCASSSGLRRLNRCAAFAALARDVAAAPPDEIVTTR